MLYNTYENPVTKRKSYDELTTYLNNGIKTISAGAKSIKYNFSMVQELPTNTNVIWVSLCMLESTYLKYEDVILDTDNSDEIAKSMAEIAKTIAAQYPEKQVGITITFSHIFDSYPEEYYDEGFTVLEQDDDQYLVIGIINEVYDIIGDDYNYIWYY